MYYKKYREGVPCRVAMFGSQIETMTAVSSYIIRSIGRVYCTPCPVAMFGGQVENMTAVSKYILNKLKTYCHWKSEELLQKVMIVVRSK